MAKGKYQKWLEPDGLLLLRAWARDGLTDEQIAHNCGITASTLYAWKDKYSEISEALQKSKEIVDIEVENALRKRATGFEYTEEKVEMFTDEGGNVRSKKVTQTLKVVPPDTGAAILWLKNRLPKKWRDRHFDQQDDTDTINQNIMSMADLLRNPRPNRTIGEIEKKGESK